MRWLILMILHMNGTVMVGPIDGVTFYRSFDECMMYIYSVAEQYRPPQNAHAIFRCAVDERPA